MSPDAFPYAFAGLLASTIIEAVLAWRWVPAYFRSGVVVFRQTVPLHGGYGSALPDTDAITSALTTRMFAPLLFVSVGANELAFREKALGFHLFSYTPVMHGHVQSYPFEGRIVVRGLLNWSTLALLAFVPLTLEQQDWTPFLPFLLGVVSFIYGIQAIRYRQVAVYLAGAQHPAA